jgi:hypothetical protein
MVDFYCLKGWPVWIADLLEEVEKPEAAVEFLYDLSKALLEHRIVREDSKALNGPLDSGVPSAYYHAEDKASATE